MKQDLRRQRLESFGRAPALLCAALRQFPKKMWIFKPAIERWSIHEIIMHLPIAKPAPMCAAVLTSPSPPLVQPQNSAPRAGQVRSVIFTRALAKLWKSSAASEK